MLSCPRKKPHGILTPADDKASEGALGRLGSGDPAPIGTAEHAPALQDEAAPTLLEALPGQLPGKRP